MAEVTNTTITQTKEDSEELDFLLFGDEEYTEVHDVGQFSMRFRILTTEELTIADMVASKFPEEALGAKSIEREVLWLYYAVVGVGKKGSEPKDFTFDKSDEEVMKKQIQWIHRWPYFLIVEALDKYQKTLENYRDKCLPDRIKNSQGEPG